MSQDTASPIKLVCDGCGTKLSARESLQGRSTKCPKCGAPVAVPMKRFHTPIPIEPEPEEPALQPVPTFDPWQEINAFRIESRVRQDKMIELLAWIEQHLKVIRFRVGWFFAIFIVIPLVFVVVNFAAIVLLVGAAAHR